MASSPSHLSSGSDLEKREKPVGELILDKPVESLFLDDALEKRVWRKLDLYVLPVVSMFYLLSFIDRTNVANARVAGMQADLKMTNHDYSVALTVTYVPYIIAELPSNLLLKVLSRPIVVYWHVGSSLDCSKVGFPSVLVSSSCLMDCIRWCIPRPRSLPFLLLSAAEDGSHRISAFFSCASLSGAFSGLLAFGIINLDGVGGKRGWAWIFFLEGIFTVLFGVVSFWLLPKSPAHAYFFNEKEKNYVIERLKDDGATGKDASVDAFSWREVRKAFTLPQTWILGVVLFCDGTVLYGLAYFAPSIIQGLGFTAARAQLMSVPPFAVAFVTAMISAFISDHYHCRGLVLIFSSVMCVIGFGMFLGSQSHSVQYGSLFMSIPGTYIVAPTLSTWLANNVAPHTRRATAIAIGFMLTNFGGILATWLLGALSPAPRYTKATIVLLVFSVLMVLFSALNLGYLWDQNKKKRVIREGMDMSTEDLSLGDKSAWFEYNL